MFLASHQGERRALPGTILVIGSNDECIHRPVSTTTIKRMPGQ